MVKQLKAPFPYFGGKSRVADVVWDRLGNVDNYVEPFAGSLAVLLRRPEVGKIETINDRNHFVANFWRAVQADPEGVAEYADNPVSEADLHARHEYLVNSHNTIEFRDRMKSDPEFFDSRFAGWWVWGQCCWIGGGWCDDSHRNCKANNSRPNFGPDSQGNGVNRPSKMPLCDSRGSKGVNGQSQQLPDLAGDGGAFGRGVASSAGHNKRPVLRSDCESRGVASLGRPQLGDAFDIGRGIGS